MRLASNETVMLGVPLRLTVSLTAVTEDVVGQLTVAVMGIVSQL
jgi:hypothetical protein